MARYGTGQAALNTGQGDAVAALLGGYSPNLANSYTGQGTALGNVAMGGAAAQSNLAGQQGLAEAELASRLAQRGKPGCTAAKAAQLPALPVARQASASISQPRSRLHTPKHTATRRLRSSRAAQIYGAGCLAPPTLALASTAAAPAPTQLRNCSRLEPARTG